MPASRLGGGAAAARFCCFGCRMAWELARPAAAEGPGGGPRGTLVLRLGLGIFLALNIMVFSWVFYSAELVPSADGAHPELASLFAWLLLFLATVVVVILGFPLAVDAAQGLRPAPGARLPRLDADLLICVGVGAAWVLSAIHTVRGRGSLYFDTAAMVLVVVTLGRYLEAGARRRAVEAACEALADLPRRLRVRRDGPVEIEAGEVVAGDTVLVRAGETVGVDGRVLAGTSHVDESRLRGESRPRTVAPGDAVLAGTTSLDGALEVRAETVGADMAVSRVRQLFEQARAGVPPIQRTADRVAAWFVPAVVLFAVAVFAANVAAGHATNGLFDALSVLLISCPCALGLAAPLASWTALRRLAAQGVLVDSAETLERAARVRRLFLDKTGTLTEPRPRLERIEPAAGVSADAALLDAAALESTSLHPLAEAIVAAARHASPDIPDVQAARTLPGEGIEGRVRGRLLRLGARRWIERPGLESGGLLDAGGGATADAGTLVWLADERRVLARFHLRERARHDAAVAIDGLRRLGIEAGVLSGDRAAAAAALGSALGVAVEADLLPGDKLERLAAARRAAPAGTAVGMVGDGINDAPVLAAADVGVAVGSAADLARRAGNVQLIADRLDRVPLLLATARDALRRIRLNLGFAFAYNGVGVVLAATGRLSPIVAACAMVASSLTVVAISRGAGKRVRERYGLRAADLTAASDPAEAAIGPTTLAAPS